MAGPDDALPPLTPGQNRMLVVLTVILGVASLAIPVIWNAGNHGAAKWTALGLGVVFLLGAIGLSRSIGRSQHRSTWSVFFLRRPR